MYTIPVNSQTYITASQSGAIFVGYGDMHLPATDLVSGETAFGFLPVGDTLYVFGTQIAVCCQDYASRSMNLDGTTSAGLIVLTYFEDVNGDPLWLASGANGWMQS